jgi:NitT/TauT family transport system substrate-binding protein
MKKTAIAVLMLTAVVLTAGYSDTNKLKKYFVGYSGGTCEAPSFVAYHKGFFKAEGLDVDFQLYGFDALKTGLSTGKIDGTVGNFGWFKLIEQGFGIKLTGGLHAGCISLVAPKNSGIKTLKDLKGKTIGVDEIGQGPQIDLSIALRGVGLDPKTDVNWKAFPPPQLLEAAKKKQVDAYVVWDPFASDAISKEGYVELFNIAKDEPFKSGYCCYATVSAASLKRDPAAAAAYTRAILKAAKWVGEHPEETAQIEVSNKYVDDTVEHTTALIKSYYWRPSIDRAADSAKFFIKEQKKDGILEATTDEKKLFDKLFAYIVKDEEIGSK